MHGEKKYMQRQTNFYCNNYPEGKYQYLTRLKINECVWCFQCEKFWKMFCNINNLYLNVLYHFIFIFSLYRMTQISLEIWCCKYDYLLLACNIQLLKYIIWRRFGHRLLILWMILLWTTCFFPSGAPDLSWWPVVPWSWRMPVIPLETLTSSWPQELMSRPVSCHCLVSSVWDWLLSRNV